MKNLQLTLTTETELLTHIQSICNEILDFKKNETTTIENTINDLKNGFDLDKSEVEKISSILIPKLSCNYEKLVKENQPLLMSLCYILNVNINDKSGNELDMETLKKRVTNKKHRVSLSADTPTETLESETDTTQKELP